MLDIFRRIWAGYTGKGRTMTFS